MKDIYIKYNPYKVETMIEIDGRPADERGGLVYAFDHRLQEWIEPRPSWKGIFRELKDETLADDIRIRFHGTAFDYNDLQYAKERYGGDFESVSLIHENEQTSQQYDQVEKLQALKQLYQELQDGPIEEFKAEDIRAAFESAIGSDFEIVVIAPMSSGKSTLINAILGQDLLPAVNQATTAIITRIRDNDSLTQFLVTAEDGEGNPLCYVVNEDGTYHFGSEGTSVENVPAGPDLIRALNYAIDPADPNKKKALVDTAYIEGPIEAIPSDRINAVFVDTPGGNNSENMHHQDIMDEAIRDENKSLILYVFNGTQTGTYDGDAILQRIAEEMEHSRNGKQSRDRFLFVANRMDDFDTEKEDYGEYIKTSILPGLAKYGINEPQLFLVSAQLAKLIRMQRHGCRLTKQEHSWLNGTGSLFGDTTDRDPAYRLYKYSSISDRAKADFDSQLEALYEDDQNAGWNPEIAEINSGVPALEAAIREYVEKYAVCIKINDAHEKFMGKVRDRAMMDACQARLAASIEELDRMRDEIREKEKCLEEDKTLQGFKEQIEAISFDQKEILQREISLRKALDKVQCDFSDNGTEPVKKQLPEGATIAAVTGVPPLRDGFRSLMGRMERDTAGSGTVSKDEARKILNKFSREAEEEMESAQQDCIRLLNDGVIERCNQILQEYEGYIRELRDRGFFSLGGLRVDVLSNFKQFKIENVEGLLGKEEYIKITKRTERVKKSGFFNALRRLFGNPDGWETETSSKEEVRINELIKDMIAEVMTDFSQTLHSNMDETENRIKDVKNTALEKLSGVTQLIQDTMSAITEMTADQKKLQQRVEDNRSNLEWMQNFISRVDSILDI